ncbi:MAG: DUF2178 domain-containing protein [Bacteroidota bacterium]
MNTSYQENRTLSYLISTVAVSTYYLYFLWGEYQMGAFEGERMASEWGWTVLKLIGANVVLSIIASIAVSITYAILNKEQEKEVTDERDRLFELKASKISFGAFGIGFLGAMLALGLGAGPIWMLNLTVLSILFAAMLGYVAQLYFYRRG